MKKFTHPKKHTSIIVSHNGSSNYGETYSNSDFIATSFDFRSTFETSQFEQEETHVEFKIITFINEYKYFNYEILWLNFKNDNSTPANY